MAVDQRLITFWKVIHSGSPITLSLKGTRSSYKGRRSVASRSSRSTAGASCGACWLESRGTVSPWATSGRLFRGRDDGDWGGGAIGVGEVEGSER